MEGGFVFRNKHRYFIQFMLQNGTVPLQKAVEVAKKLDPEMDSATHVKTLVLQINTEIKKDGFLIAQGKCEVTGNDVLMWLNTKDDHVSRLQVAFSKVELEYFHAILLKIVDAENKRIPYPLCLNLTSTLTAPLSQAAGEKTFMRMVKGGYYVREGAYVYLGPRVIAEFTVYLRRIAGNCICDLCSELVFVGRTCRACGETFHSSCLDTYMQNQVTCPKCNLKWSEKDIAPAQGTSQIDIAEKSSGGDGPSQRN